MFWDRAAGVYDLFANVWNKKTHGALCAYVEAQISPADEVLECACGTGLLTEGIAAKCKRLVATDFSEKMLEKAEKKCGKFGNVTFKRENILQIGEPDGRLLAVEVIRTEERNRILHFCMDEMNPDYREVLYLTYFEDMSYAQAAEVTGKTVKQITNMVYRGKESLRRLLEREGITNAEP